jgi:hypothetical protein
MQLTERLRKLNFQAMEHASLLIIALPCGFLVSAVTQVALLHSVMCSTQADNNSRKLRLPASLVCPRPNNISNVGDVLVFRGIKGTTPSPRQHY